MKVFISAGEASGDAYGAALVKRLRDLGPQLDVIAMGGAKLKALDVPLIADSSGWGTISTLHALMMLAREWPAFYRIKRYLRTTEPGLFIPIDFGAANVKFARFAKEAGWKVLYFIPPGSWRRDRAGKDMPFITDAIVTPFSWNQKLLAEMGANAHWYGHPLKELLADTLSQVGTAPRSGLAVLPGSRQHELAEHLPILAKVLRGRSEAVTFALASEANVEAIRKRWHGLSGRTSDEFVQGNAAAVLLRSRAALVCSGTATLEAAMCRCPSVVFYRLSKLVILEARLAGFKRPKFVSLPNILLDEEVVPEMIQENATPEAITRELDAILKDGKARADQLMAFQRLDEVLGEDRAITRAAVLAKYLMTPDAPKLGDDPSSPA